MIAEMIRRQRVDGWYESGSLKELFALGTKSPVTLGHTGTWYILEHIYCPIRLPTVAGMPANWTYYDIGYTDGQLAAMFWTEYRLNWINEYYETAAAFRAAAANGESRTLKLMEAVVRANVEKYMHLIELQGYTYNPLYNVDGEELYSSADMHGDETTTSVFDDTRTHTVSTFDGTLKQEYSDSTKSPLSGDTQTKTHIGTGLGTSADDNAFSGGGAIASADAYHVDKRVRRGNIGLTKSTELIEAQRQALRYSVVQEFFDDLYKAIILPIY